MDSRKAKFILWDPGARKAISKEAALFTTSTCPEIRGHLGGPLFPADVFFRPRQRFQCRRSLPLRCPTKMRERFFRRCDGPVARRNWQGGLPLQYRLGPTTDKLHLVIENDKKVRSIWNVVGRLRGSERPDEWVVLGNHRDAWVFGGVDPSSGSATMMETARALGELKRSGWKPRRTLIFASWDAEEFTLTGSTEWGELEAERLKAGALAYLNVDSSASGNNFSACGCARTRKFSARGCARRA